MNKKFKVAVIRVVTLKNDEDISLHGRLIEKYFPQISTISMCIEDQPTGVHDEETEALAVPKIISLAQKLEKDVDAIVISCAGDPAVKELKEKLSIPVIGAGEATAFLAKRYGENYGVLGITDLPPRAYVSAFNNIIGDCRPEGVNCTLDLQNEEGRSKVVKKALELKSLGADVIALACTGMSTIGISSELEKACKIPIIDPVMAEGLMTYFECLRRRV